MKVIYTNLSPADGFTVCPWLILIKPAFKPDTALLAHEMVHVGQMQKVGLIRWWCGYLFSAEARQGYEVEAYREQTRLGMNAGIAALMLSGNYRLSLSPERALELLTTHPGEA